MIRRGTFASRALALGALFAPLILLGGGFAVWAVQSWADASARLERAERLERELSARSVQARAYVRLLERWREYVDSPNSGLARPAGDVAAATDILNRVGDALAARGGRVLSHAPRDAVTIDGLRRASIDVVATAPENELDALLQAIEVEPPYLFLDYVEIRRKTDAEPGMVALRLGLSSFRLAEVPG